MCQSPTDCNNHGDCVQSKCFCDVGWFLETCTQNIKDQWSEAFYFYQGFYIALFTVVAVFAIQTLGEQITERSLINSLRQISIKFALIGNRGLRLVCNVIAAPQNTCYALCILFCFFKIVWIGSDPFQMNGYLERHFERLLAEIVYSILFAIYGVILIVWYTIYDEIHFNLSNDKLPKTCLAKFFKCILKLRIVMVFIIQVGVSVVKGVRMNPNYRYYSYTSYAILYINFIKKLVCSLLNSFSMVDKQKNRSHYLHERRSMRVSKIEYLSLLTKKSQKKNRKNQKLGFSVSKIDANGSSNFKQVNSIVNDSSNLIHEMSDSKIESSKKVSNKHLQGDSFQKQHLFVSQVDDEFYYIAPSETQEELYSLRQKQKSLIKELKQEKEIFKLRNNRESKLGPKRKNVIDLDFKELQMRRKEIKVSLEVLIFINFIQKTQFKSNHELLNHDKRVLNRIIGIIILGVLLEVGFAILSVIVYVSTLLQMPIGNDLFIMIYLLKGTLAILFIVSLLELLSLVVVLKLFTSIQSKEVDNLRWVTKVNGFKKKVNEVLQFRIPDNLKFEDRSFCHFEERINI